MSLRGLDAPVALLLARRYARSTRREAFGRFLALAAVAGIGVGVAALVLALSALAGFQTALKGEILARTPESEISLPPEADLEGASRRLAAIPQVEVRRSLEGRGWLLAHGRGRPVDLVGYEGDLPVHFPGASGRVPGTYLSDGLLDAWGLAPGDRVEVASNRPMLTPFGPQPRVRALEIAGSFESGQTEEIERIALPIDVAISLLGPEAQRLQVSTGDLDRALALVPRIEAAVPEALSVVTWRELNRSLFFALRLEKTVLFLAVSLIVAVAGLSLLSGLLLTLSSKRREVGMLGAMGLPARTLRHAFLSLAGLLAGTGLLTGAVVGVAAAWILDRFRVLRLPDAVYFVDHVPFRLQASDLGAIVACTVALAGACAWAAARRAGALDPVEALRR